MKNRIISGASILLSEWFSGGYKNLFSIIHLYKTALVGCKNQCSVMKINYGKGIL
jgi:hypothetical protein